MRFAKESKFAILKYICSFTIYWQILRKRTSHAGFAEKEGVAKKKERHEP